ncbi:MAG: nucleotidyltransferase family protein [Pyrinomonadaceae bacterium]|nr:nucleotidyltransferase family protein [Pyrinomonadaceae bacterium]
MNEPNTSNNQQKIGLILLAAGESKRMKGTPKQLLKFRGKTLLTLAANTALDSKCKPIVAVLGANSNALLDEIKDLPLLTIIENKNWRLGMGSSIKTGLAKLLQIEPDLIGIIVMLCDQPLLRSETLDLLIETHEKTHKPIVACKYQETIGVPVLFGRDFFQRLQQLTTDSGAKELIMINKNSTETINLEESFDVDTPQDYARLLRLEES